ncbi:NAD-P-binding protein [Trametes versicolor FP-101664 SS1]|uniref:NAD-P-binding protein n=1 Tax=Trametes versicolor (strain FP-101664) TaxID=717944 RepID=UPI0004623034|nr:NAD-P-binding protein [Trametes versicolor FP-101664 SS1]EIW57685.1 NAD-P-binding protein [Trametes versicolor FP-101664 SS1]
MTPRPLLIVAGIGNGTGTGAASARAFSAVGYRVALVARNAEHLNRLVGELTASEAQVAAFPVPEYTYEAVISVFDSIMQHQWATNEPSELRVALWNVGVNVFGSFLSVTEKDITASLEVHVTAGFAFARKVILAFKENALDAQGCRGTLLFTGATASVRGNVFTSAFAAGKFGIRALSQSLAKEFGKENMHVIIDGSILTDLSASRRSGEAGEAWKADPDVRLDADSIAKSYLYLVQQDRSAWTWELDLRPAHEKW